MTFVIRKFVTFWNPKLLMSKLVKLEYIFEF